MSIKMIPERYYFGPDRLNDAQTLLASQLPARLLFILCLSSQEATFSEARPHRAQGQGWATAARTTGLEPTSFLGRLCNELVKNVTFMGKV